MHELKHLFIIGAPKAGTSTLAEVLNGHPEIHLGVEKEPRFFCDFADRSWTGPGHEEFCRSMTTRVDAYDALFAGAPAGAWRLDASTDYLANASARTRLAELSRQHPVKLICLLRDPVERVISQYRHTLRDLLEDSSLLDALTQENARRDKGWQPLFWHIRRSQYHEDIAAYKAAFGDRLMLVDFAELRDQKTLVNRILQFLNLSPEALGGSTVVDEARNSVVRNKSFSYRNPKLQRALDDPSLRHVAQKLVPRPLRSWVRENLVKANTTTYHPSETELQTIFAALQDDICKSLADPCVPTGSWQLSRRLRDAYANMATPDEGPEPLPSGTARGCG